MAIGLDAGEIVDIKVHNSRLDADGRPLSSLRSSRDAVLHAP
jgi:hypothetical protein